MRQDLQVKLIQSEQQLATLKSSLSNGPSLELIDSPAHSDITPSECGETGEGVRVCVISLSLSLSAVVERVTCRVQIPKSHNPRKQGWREVVSFSDNYIMMI